MAIAKTTAPPQPPQPSPSDDLVDGWFAAWFFNIGLPADLYNRFFQAKEDLKARLAGKE